MILKTMLSERNQAKKKKKKIHTVLFHLCKILENANQSIVTPGSSPVAQC